MQRTVLLLAMILTCFGAAYARRVQARRVVVPIRQTVMQKGVIRYSVPIFVGHTRLNAMLDTGSTGIRVLPGATRPGDLSPTRQSATYSYGSGVKLSGVIAHAMVAVGGLRGAQPISVDDIKKIGCTHGKQHCIASRVSQQDYRFGGHSGKGFEAIIGISLAPSSAANPLSALGAPAWIVILPKPGDARPGSLILNPNRADLAGFDNFQLDVTRKPLQALAACLTDLRSNRKVCAPTVLDSGTPSVNVNLRRRGARFRLRRGDQAQMSFGANAGRLPRVAFTVRAAGPDRVIVRAKAPKRAGQYPFINAGILPYFTYDVLYDSAHNTLGLKPRRETRR